jgi:hypothetical protein
MQYYTECDLVSGPTTVSCSEPNTSYHKLDLFPTLQGGFATVKLGPLPGMVLFISVGS